MTRRCATNSLRFKLAPRGETKTEQCAPKGEKCERKQKKRHKHGKRKRKDANRINVKIKTNKSRNPIAKEQHKIRNRESQTHHRLSTTQSTWAQGACLVSCERRAPVGRVRGRRGGRMAFEMHRLRTSWTQDSRNRKRMKIRRPA
jgi:hypothetical protein